MEKGKQIELIQVMRLGGAVLVILFHSNLIGYRGYFGVDIFSVISGYIMMYSTRNPGSRKHFLFKRLIRIVPLYWLMTVLNYLILTVLPQLSVMSEAKPEYLIKSMLFLPFVNKRGYDTPILGLGWTLNYEVMFYLIFFAAIHFSHKWRGLTAGILMAGMAAAGWATEFEHLFFNYYTDSFILEFLWGIGAFYLIEWLEKYEKSRFFKGVCLAVGLLSLIFMCFDSFDSPIPRCLRLGIPAFLFFTAFMAAYRGLHFNKQLVAVGGMTYSIYLVEYFTTALYKVVCGRQSFMEQLAGGAALVIVTIACAYVPYRLVECRGTEFLKTRLLQ